MQTNDHGQRRVIIEGVKPEIDAGRYPVKRIVGDAHLKMILQPVGGNNSVDAIAFNQTGDDLSEEQKIRVAYRLEVNEFRGQRTVQLNIQYFEPVVFDQVSL